MIALGKVRGLILIEKVAAFKKTGNQPHICTISIQNEILRSDKTRVLFHTFPIIFFPYYYC